MLYLLIVIIFLILWLLKSKAPKVYKSKANLNNNSFSKTSPKSNKNLSDFQKWLLKYSNCSNSEQLKNKRKKAFDLDDWNQLSADDYNQWSSFHWGI